MKLKNILMTGLAALALVSCDDFLSVDAPSSYTEEFVYSQKSEISRALNGVYASILVGDLYGNNFQSTFQLNSDVDMATYTSNVATHNSYRRFDCDSEGSEINKYWTAAYNAIEYANRFIYNLENSPLYDENDSEIMQWLGEAKCLRAMVYHDLVVMFGDVPFTFTAAAQLGNEYIIPVAERLTIQDALIKDLETIAPKMTSSATTTVERASKEFAYAMIARIALTAGGYSLHPDKSNVSSYGTMQRPSNYQDYYSIVKTYTDKVIQSGVHSLGLSYQDVFIKESNFEVVNGGDVIFEIPFAKESTGNTGYIQGPKSETNNAVTAGKNVWGESKGNVGLSAFYRWAFDKNDLRRNFTNGLWYYGNNSDASAQDSCLFIGNSYTVYNNKWSKLWANAGQFTNISTGNTGINFPYMRYTDVLLMNAEAINELNGPIAEAQESLRLVRARAFNDQNEVTNYLAEVSTDKETFLKAVLNERKLEFAGENMRWRDLVRNNIYNREIVYSFLRYLTVGSNNAGVDIGYMDDIIEHDNSDYLEKLPETVYYHVLPQNTSAWKISSDMIYGYPYPNTTMDILYVYNPDENTSSPSNSACAIDNKVWESAECFQWSDGTVPRNQCKYSFYGYIRHTESDEIMIVKDGAEQPLQANTVPTADKLPPVRYILPYPNTAIQRSAGAYKNYYGYTN